MAKPKTTDADRVEMTDKERAERAEHYTSDAADFVISDAPEDQGERRSGRDALARAVAGRRAKG